MVSGPVATFARAPRRHPGPLPAKEAERVFTPSTTLMDSERALILQTLQAVGWVIGGAKGAAARLGLKRTTLMSRMSKMGISRPCFQSRQDVMDPQPGS
jgi:formate hydrogenlyase transcriptional activator